MIKKQLLITILSAIAVIFLSLAGCNVSDNGENGKTTHTHKYVSVVTTPATCTENGVITYTCIDGDDSYTEEIAPLDHDFIHHLEKAPTCTAIGWNEYDTCSRCDYTTYSEIPATDHDYIFTEFIWNETSAQAKYVCSHDDSHVELYDATVTEKITAATCEQEGKRTYTAVYDENSDIKTEVIAALNHEWGDWQTINAPDCGIEGTEERVCARDNSHKETKTMPAINHNYEFKEFVWNGSAAQAKFVCSHNENHTELFDATVTEYIVTAATCEQEGKRTYTAVYGENSNIKTEVIAALGHEWRNWEAVRSPSCESSGLAQRVCARDNSHKETKTMPAINHNYEFKEFVWNGSVAQAKYVCSHNSTHVESYNATVTEKVTVEATYEKEGVRTYTAVYDGHSDTKTESIPKLVPEEPSTPGLTFKLTNKGTEYFVTGYTGTDSFVRIPSTYQGKPVTYIYKQAFEGCTVITKLLLPENVTGIGNAAFYKCDNLKYVYYTGTYAKLKKISKGTLNVKFENAITYIYTETQPTSGGNYWHYVDGNVTVWKI